MRWRLAGLCTLSLGLLGCPEEHGMDGAIDQAVLRDMKAALQEDGQRTCPTPEQVKVLCADPKSKNCPQECK
jgi:hypothetical protein